VELALENNLVGSCAPRDLLKEALRTIAVAVGSNGLDDSPVTDAGVLMDAGVICDEKKKGKRGEQCLPCQKISLLHRFTEITQRLVLFNLAPGFPASRLPLGPKFIILA